jgi:uncharacterized linocin/CFP29 family protein
MEILNRVKAPFGSSVWTEIETVLGDFLSKRLNIRSIVDFNDTITYDDDAIATKNLTEISNTKGLSISTREPVKIMEIKKTFSISKDVIEDIKRGVVDYNDKEFIDAANEFATIENNLMLQGLDEANMKGIMSYKEIESVDAQSTKDILAAVAKSLGTFNKKFVEGPYKLVISSSTLAKLYTEFFDGISVKAKLDEILGAGNIVVNEDIGDSNAVLISQRGGDFEFFSGLDISIGFEKETDKNVTLFLIQTCTFRIIGPEAAISIHIK